MLFTQRWNRLPDYSSKEQGIEVIVRGVVQENRGILGKSARSLFGSKGMGALVKFYWVTGSWLYLPFYGSIDEKLVKTRKNREPPHWLQ